MRKSFAYCKIDNPLNPEIIHKEVLEYFGVSDYDFKDKREGESIVFVRQVATYILWHYTNLKQREIAVLIKRDRSTIPHSLQQIVGRCQHYPEIRNQIIEIETKIDRDENYMRELWA